MRKSKPIKPSQMLNWERAARDEKRRSGQMGQTVQRIAGYQIATEDGRNNPSFPKIASYTSNRHCHTALEVVYSLRSAVDKVDTRTLLNTSNIQSYSTHTHSTDGFAPAAWASAAEQSSIEDRDVSRAVGVVERVVRFGDNDIYQSSSDARSQIVRDSVELDDEVLLDDLRLYLADFEAQTVDHNLLFCCSNTVPHSTCLRPVVVEGGRQFTGECTCQAAPLLSELGE
ncbi:hypothetical protein KCU81_g454, partial [Aureobasidium melanogenum]